jgi:hypothetical protein
LKNCWPDYLVVVDNTTKNIIGGVKPSHGSHAGVKWGFAAFGPFWP